jgi:hypothetical protein
MSVGMPTREIARRVRRKHATLAILREEYHHGLAFAQASALG